ncbi:hypothetical protein AB0L70_26480 [Kribbella sp. NPDC051952]|uniref:hypothetical protein n=1 Tax=Kribbella sp. NPDC051952 TaxID=3154851 RepID=UPI00343AF51F
MSKHSSIELLSRLDPIATDDPGEAVQADTRSDMLTRITQTPQAGSKSTVSKGPASKGPASRGSASKSSARRRRLVPVLVAATVVAAAAITVVELPGDSRQEALSPALSFSPEGNFLRVRIVDPYADTARYNKEFKKRHLNITLELMPGSPSIVGQSPAAAFGDGSANIEQSDDPPGCAEAGTVPCVPQFLVPKDYSGEAGLVIARAARPGEDIQFGGPIDGRGEALNGVKYKNLQVSQVLKILTQRGYTVPEYRLAGNNATGSPKKVPGTYFVKDGFLHKDKEVILFVSPKR